MMTKFRTTLLIVLCIVIIVYVIKDYNSSNDPMLSQLREDLIKVDPRASQLSFYKGDKSYSINKHKIYLCLNDKYGNYYSKNTLMYVSLHELAHCLNKFDTGHSDAFYNMFRILLHKAHVMGLYNPNLAIPDNYCQT